jgi:uncharacterized membrane protein YfcA
MIFHDLSLVIIGFLSELLGTISGFGSSTFFVPYALFFEKLQFVLALTSLLHCFGNISKLTLFKFKIDKILFLKLVVPSIILTGIGAILSKYIHVDYLQRILGVVLILLPLTFFIKKDINKKVPVRFSIFLTGFSGFTTGLIGTGGAIRGLALSLLNIEKNSFIALSAAIDLGGDLARAGIYLYNGYMDWSQWYYIPLLGAAAFFGTWLGRKIVNAFSQKQFEKTVAIFVFISGLTMIFR